MPTLEIAAILLLTIANGIFAMAEIAVVSARRARLDARAQEGSKGARVALELATNPNDFLSTVQVGITLIGTLAGAFGGATLAEEMAAHLNAVPWIAPHGETVALTIVVLAISYLSLIIGELVPKRLALSNPERFASALAPPMRLVAKIAGPAVRFLSWSTDVVLRLIPLKHEEQQTVTEEEVRHMIEQGAESGAFERAEQDMVEGVFRLGDRIVGELMTPRHEISWIDLEDPPTRIREILQQHRYSRFPVAVGALDNLKGFVHVKDLLNESLSGRGLDVPAALKQAPAVPETMRALRALEALQAANSHLAFVVNEHGGVEGLVTVVDLLKAIIGDLPASESDNEPMAIRREDGSWLLDGMLPAYELKELLGIRKLAGEDEASFTTLGGFVMTSLGQVPRTGDHFKFEGWRFEVADMDRNRVDKVLVAAMPEARTEGVI